MKKVFNFSILIVTALALISCAGKQSSTNDDNSAASAESSSVSNTGDGLSATYFNMLNSGTYHLKAKMKGGDGSETTMESYYKDGMTAVTMEMEGHSSKMIYRDNKMYIINDAGKTYMVMPIPQNSSSNEAVKTDGMTRTGSGTAEFNGKNLPYEEYSSSEGGKAQFFLDGKKIAGIRNIIDNESVMDIIISVLDTNVPANAFDVPSGYKKNEVGY
ncbi:MAG: hypothetical protein FWC39_05275 [Bacteroidetes bacterium]|nr:hypothetical protein [Bacteroidota bacterium]